MEEMLLGILDGGVNFNSLGQVILIYLAILWTMISLWVFFDARKRYDNMFLPIGFFLATLLLNFPVLILYMIVRPDPTEYSEATSNLSIPVIDFVKEDGTLELSLKINLTPLSGNSYVLKSSEEINTSSQSIVINKTPEVTVTNTSDVKVSKKENLSNIIKKGRENTKKSFSKLKVSLPKKNKKSNISEVSVESNSKEI